MDRIAAAEAGAVAEVRNAAAEIADRRARAPSSPSGIDAEADAALIDQPPCADLPDGAARRLTPDRPRHGVTRKRGASTGPPFCFARPALPMQPPPRIDRWETQ